MEPLDERKQQILRAVILEYVAGAEPIGSETLTQKYDLGVRSATVRNELSELSEMGLLEQPHTSAGRIPSDLGYRYYVDHLVIFAPPEANAKSKVKGAAEEGEALQTMLAETTRVLSRMTQLLTAATTLKNQQQKVRNAIISAIGPDKALLVLVLANGHVENRMLDCPKGLSLTDVGRANDVLAGQLEGMTLSALAKYRAPNADSILEKLLLGAANALRSMARELTRGKLVKHGEEYLFAKPEFQRDSGQLRSLVNTLEAEETIMNALANPSSEQQTITIGREHRAESLQQFSVLRNSFYIGEDEAGALALIGPTRLDYDHSVPLLQFAAEAIGATLTKMLK